MPDKRGSKMFCTPMKICFLASFQMLGPVFDIIFFKFLGPSSNAE